jgi:hypothetical protein
MLYWAVHEARYPSQPGGDVPEGKAYDSMDRGCPALTVSAANGGKLNRGFGGIVVVARPAGPQPRSNGDATAGAAPLSLEEREDPEGDQAQGDDNQQPGAEAGRGE